MLLFLKRLLLSAVRIVAVDEAVAVVVEAIVTDLGRTGIHARIVVVTIPAGSDVEPITIGVDLTAQVDALEKNMLESPSLNPDLRSIKKPSFRTRRPCVRAGPGR